jgi:sporulation inhibitor KapD
VEEQTLSEKRNYLVVDFEFTTFDKPVGRPRAFFSEILEFGAVLVEPPAAELGASCQGFVKPRFFPQLAKDSLEFAMISEADLASGMNFEQMLDELARLYRPGQTYLTAWGDADWSVLSTACARYQVENPFRFADYLDLAYNYRTHFGYPRTPSLKDALDEQAIAGEGYWHTALSDATGTARLVLRLLELGWVPKAGIDTSLRFPGR